MSPKADNFLRALDTLCREHGVTISTSAYDLIQLWDFDGETIYGGFSQIEDATKLTTIAPAPLDTLINK